MPNPSLTRIVFLLDRSGSMASIRTDVIGGFDAFLTEQRAGQGDCTVTLAQFDNEYEVVYQGIPLADVPPLALLPRGGTALFDSMGRVITDTAAEIAAMPEADRPGTVVVAIMTDGMENSSKEWRQSDVRALVERQTDEHGWEFLYMGADQDAVEVGRGLGVREGQSITYSRGRSREAMAAASGNLRGYRTARIADPAAMMPEFTDDQRAHLAADDAATS
ncbi:VWA domain-containing protein [Mycobacterium sp. ITM-2016-00317]|uniref:VWA domain-containing protein n=1 Tax=Mycobacterium sp. ITM-2016-00317 TaxID=2099694 RepID=UPI000D45EF67|nr:VWA domain-containing protein [Mycobacterium sp. ITM-2016-00317]WNG87769.1 VWA domain-containing protein [Mycobacterium sp. ITM-2016-00317]